MGYESCQRAGESPHCSISYYRPIYPFFQLSNDPSLSSLPLLSTFLKSYSLPFLGLTPSSGTKQQISTTAEPGTLSASTEVAENEGVAPPPEEEELVEKELRDRFKRMCEGYFDSVSKKLVKEHMVRCHHNISAYMSLISTIIRDCKSKIEKTTKRTYVPGRFLRIGNRLMKR
jgi:regulator of nonsense transcripts 2